MTDLTNYTVRDLCTLALQMSGVISDGQTASAEQITRAHVLLQGMMRQWRQRRWLVYRLVESSFIGTGAVTYSVGPSGADVTLNPRPAQIEAAKVVQVAPGSPTPISWPMKLIHSFEDYYQIQLYNLSSIPDHLFYDPTLPNGTLYPWPLPSSSYQVKFLTKLAIDGFDDLNGDLTDLPDEYFEALWSNLAIRVNIPTGDQINPDVKDIARASLATIRGANYAIARLQMPRNVSTQRYGARFNIYSGYQS